jgi:hypothetical protein
MTAEGTVGAPTCFIRLYSAIAMLATCPRTQGYIFFSALIVGLAGPRTQATCLAGSGVNRSTIHFDPENSHTMHCHS